MPVRRVSVRAPSAIRSGKVGVEGSPSRPSQQHPKPRQSFAPNNPVSSRKMLEPRHPGNPLKHGGISSSRKNLHCLSQVENRPARLTFLFSIPHSLRPLAAVVHLILGVYYGRAQKGQTLRSLPACSSLHVQAPPDGVPHRPVARCFPYRDFLSLGRSRRVRHGSGTYFLATCGARAWHVCPGPCQRQISSQHADTWRSYASVWHRSSH